ncbi:uncharacterized protein M6B38_275065 [Iris pallida]|uniref:Uncharacterized protein n=1 Tax=Iris pallida TaxID=29817 RepID=A0AAX6I5J6_IRIPA|nr:uncharacterized protein M6B38_275065 [Iris pallida]
MNMVSQDTANKSSSNILLGDVNDDSLIPEKLSQKSSLLHAPDSIIGLEDKAEGLLEPAAKLSGTSGFLRASEWEQHEGVCPMVDGEQRIRLGSKHQSLGDEGVGHLTLGEKRRKNSRPRKLTIVEPSLEGDSIRNQQDNQAVGKPPSEGLSTSHPEASTRGGTNAEGLEALDLLNSTIGSPEASCVETSVSGVQFSETGSETQKEVLLNTIGPPTKMAPSKKASGLLPFEKRSSTWELIESMEIFSRIPQQPHFLPLNQQCKELREGLAIGLMVTFSNSVNNIGQLRITDPRNKFDERLRVLLQLEAHGFDVERIRSRITELLRMKDDLEQVIMVKRSEMKAALTEKKKERDQLNVQTESVGKFVMEFEQSLSKIQDLRNSIAKQRSEKNSEVEKLRADSRTIENALQSAERAFEATLSADWQTL